ncbi:MAG: hypothetical protein ABI567_10690 [Gammaproteobacteria bacterium]
MKSSALTIALATSLATTLAVTLAGTTLPRPASAQGTSASSELAAATDDARTVLETARRTLISQGLTLTTEEDKAFWPVYNRYLQDMTPLNDLRSKVVADYAANHGSLSGDVASQLISDTLTLEEKALKLHRSYLGKFRKVLPEAKVARFYLIEGKLDAITNFLLAGRIPLIPDPPSSAPPRG